MKTTKRSTDNRKRRGVILIIVALLFLVLFGVVGLAIDMARIFIAKHQLQNAADAAALAGSRYVPLVYDPVTELPDLHVAKDVAEYYGLKHTAATVTVSLDANTNLIPDEDGVEIALDPQDPTLKADIVIGRYVESSGLFYVDHIAPDAMLVISRREGVTSPPQPKLPLLFGPIFGVKDVNLKRYAIAKVDPDYGNAILALGNHPDEDDCVAGITFQGGGSVDDLTVLNGGSVQVNSACSEAITVMGNIDVSLDRMNVVGGIDQKFFDNKKNDIESIEIGEDLGVDGIEPDPYADLPDHDLTAIRALSDKGTINDSSDLQTLSPGYYSGGIQISSADVTLAPGDYYLDSVGEMASMSMSGGTLRGDGVTLHIIGNATDGIDIQGNTEIFISAPAPDSDPYGGIAIYQTRDPDNEWPPGAVWPSVGADYPEFALNNPVSDFNGGGVIDISGAIYMPQNLLRLGGTGDIFTEQAIADRFYLYGSGQKVINYIGDRKISPKSYLVE